MSHLQQFKIIGHSLKFIWQGAPKETSLLTFYIFMQGSIPALTLITFRESIYFLTNPTDTFPWFISILWAIVLLSETLFQPLLSLMRFRLNEKTLTHFNVLLMKKANELKGLDFLENKQTSNELKQLKDEIRYRPINLIYILTSGLREWIGLISVLLLLSTVIWWLPVFILLSAIPNTVSTIWREKQAWDFALLRSPESQQMSAIAKQTLNLRAAKEIRLFGFGDFLIKKYQTIAKDLQLHFANKQKTLFFRFLLLSFPSVIGDFFIFYLIISYATKGLVSNSEMVISMQSLITVQRTIGLITQNLGHLAQTHSFFEKFYAFIHLTNSRLYKPSRPRILSSLKGNIALQNVSFAYHRGKHVLENITLNLQAGQTVAIVGENGAGKSTLIKLLCRFYDPIKGKITVDGNNLKELDLDWWLKNMSCVMQDFAEYPMTVRENIGIGNWEKMDHSLLIEQAARKGGLESTHFQNGYDTFLGKSFGGTGLSGGEWQKIALSRAFMRPAKFLILDEPTSALDARSERDLFHSFSKIAKDKTTLLITHRLASVALADRILVMKKGQIIEEGTHKQLLHQKGEYAALYDMQARNYT